MKIIICQGIPASGKSTWAKAQCENPAWVRVNKDDIRSMLFPQWNKGREYQVILAQDSMIGGFMQRHLNIVVDDTNLNPYHVNRIRNMAAETGYEVEIKTFPIDVEVAVGRDLNRSKSVGRAVIEKMYNQYKDKYEWL